MLLEISQNSQENVFARVSFLKKLQAEACNFIEKETLALVFSCEFCGISENTFFTEYFLANDFCTIQALSTDALRKTLNTKHYFNCICFPVNFAKFFRTPFSQNTPGWLLLTRHFFSFSHTQIH